MNRPRHNPDNLKRTHDMKKPDITRGKWEQSGCTVFSLTPYIGDSPRMAKALPDGLNRFSAHVSGDNPVTAGGAPLQELEANAKAITAVPDLMEALEKCHAFMSQPENRGLQHLQRIVTAALVKAGYTE